VGGAAAAALPNRRRAPNVNHEAISN